jgi:pyruvate-formate lyase
MNARIEKLCEISLNTQATISAERALLLTQFHKENEGKFSVPVMRARAFYHLCKHKTLYFGEGELIVGERGPTPKATPTYPELTCHSPEDLKILNDRPKVNYGVDQECFDIYKKTIIPYWRGRSMRDRIFQEMLPEWLDAYEAGIFTEFMEQRAPGHTVLDDKIYHKGMLDFKNEIHHAMAILDYHNDPDAFARSEQLKAMAIACDAVIVFAQRHAQLAHKLAKTESINKRKKELLKIAEVCTRVPAHAPRDFHEALQYYWFCHLAVITELNGWDAFNPGHLDQHLLVFYEK